MTIAEWMDIITDNIPENYDSHEILDILDMYADYSRESVHGNDDTECTCRTCKNKKGNQC